MTQAEKKPHGDSGDRTQVCRCRGGRITTRPKSRWRLWGWEEEGGGREVVGGGGGVDGGVEPRSLVVLDFFFFFFFFLRSPAISLGFTTFG